MYTPIDTSRVNPEKMEEAKEMATTGQTNVKINVLCFLYGRPDNSEARMAAAQFFKVALRTIDRWVVEFNLNGLDHFGDPSWARRGPKHKLDAKKFIRDFLPEAKPLIKPGPGQPTVEAVYKYAIENGRFDRSLNAFRELLDLYVDQVDETVGGKKKPQAQDAAPSSTTEPGGLATPPIPQALTPPGTGRTLESRPEDIGYRPDAGAYLRRHLRLRSATPEEIAASRTKPRNLDVPSFAPKPHPDEMSPEERERQGLLSKETIEQLKQSEEVFQRMVREEQASRAGSLPRPPAPV